MRTSGTRGTHTIAAGAFTGCHCYIMWGSFTPEGHFATGPGRWCCPCDSRCRDLQDIEAAEHVLSYCGQPLLGCARATRGCTYIHTYPPSSSKLVRVRLPSGCHLAPICGQGGPKFGPIGSNIEPSVVLSGLRLYLCIFAAFLGLPQELKALYTFSSTFLSSS